MDIAVSPVTACDYVVDCPSDLVPAFYAVGSRGKRATSSTKESNQDKTEEDLTTVPSNDSFSSKKWPIDGGEWGTNLCSYQELIITGWVEYTVSRPKEDCKYGEWNYIPVLMTFINKFWINCRHADGSVRFWDASGGELNINIFRICYLICLLFQKIVATKTISPNIWALAFMKN